MHHDWQPRVRDLTTTLVRWPSITNSPGEHAFAAELHGLLATWPYFAANPDDLWVEQAPEDQRQRSNVWALVRGHGPATVVLSGHYDVVSIANYGALAPWACDPPALLPRLIAALAAEHSTAADAAALADLQSGDYLVGRGALDMKGGIAAGLAVLEAWSELPEPRGNLLFVATPDEEDSSQGMRAAALALPRIAAARSLALRAAINLDSAGEQGDEGLGRAVFWGSVGKLLPTVFLVGRETHAGNPFDGVNVNLLAAAITQRIECCAALADVGAGEAAPPPVNLKQGDLKNYYDVTTPTTAWSTYNVLNSWPADHENAGADYRGGPRGAGRGSGVLGGPGPAVAGPERPAGPRACLAANRAELRRA